MRNLSSITQSDVWEKCLHSSTVRARKFSQWNPFSFVYSSSVAGVKSLFSCIVQMVLKVKILLKTTKKHKYCSFFSSFFYDISSATRCLVFSLIQTLWKTCESPESFFDRCTQKNRKEAAWAGYSWEIRRLHFLKYHQFNTSNGFFRSVTQTQQMQLLWYDS